MAKWKVIICKTCNKMLHYSSSWQSGCTHSYNNNCELEEKENYIFSDDLEFLFIDYGCRGAAWTWWKSKNTGTEYCVNLTNLEDFIKHSVHGVCSGNFTFKKHGANYTLIIAKQQDGSIFV